MLKIVHLLSSDSLSGAEKVALSIISSNVDQANLFYASPEGDIVENVEKLGIEHITINKISPLAIMQLYRKYKPDIIHAHDFRASTMLAYTPVRCKKISHIHQNPPWINKFNIYTIFYFFSCLFYNKIYTVSDKIFNSSIIDKYFSYKIVNASNHVDKDEILLLSNDLEVGVTYDLIYVGRLSDEKDPLRFIEIINEMKINGFPVKSALIGEGILKKTCIEYIKKNRLEENITLLGYMANPYTVMKSSKVLVVTSKWEGFGLAAVEALILGIPVAAPPVGGLVNLINDSNGKICRTNNHYIKFLMHILSDSDFHNELSNNARISAENYTKKFNWFREYEKIQ